MDRKRFVTLPIIASFVLFAFSIAFFFGFTNPNYATQSMTYSSMTFIETYVDSSLTTIESTISSYSPGDFDLSFFLPFLAGLFFLFEFINEIYFKDKDGNKVYHILSISIWGLEAINLVIFVAKFYQQYNETITDQALSFRVLSLIIVILMLLASLLYRLLYMQNKKVPFSSSGHVDGAISLFFGLALLAAAFYMEGVFASVSFIDPGIIRIGNILFFAFGGVFTLFGGYLLFYNKEYEITAKVQRFYIFALVLGVLVTFTMSLTLNAVDYGRTQIGWFTSYAITFFFMSLFLAVGHFVASPHSLISK